MSTPVASNRRRVRRARSVRSVSAICAVVISGVVAMSACGTTIESAGAASTSTAAPTSAIDTTVPVTVPETVPTTVAETTAPATTHPATTAPPPPPTQPPATTAPAPVSKVVNYDFFKARYSQTGGGLISQNYWWWDTNVPRAKVQTGHGPFATAESAEVKVMLYSSFQPQSTDATVTWDVSWSGYMTSFVGADSSAKATVTIRVYEIIPGTDTSTIGPTVFERVVAEDGVGSALQGVATLRMDDGDHQSAVLPTLDLHKFYRLEAELKCTSRVAFSVGTTVCDFGENANSGLVVNAWSIKFDNVVAT